MNLHLSEAATSGVLKQKMLLEISQNSQENTCARVFFKISCRPGPFVNLGIGIGVGIGIGIGTDITNAIISNGPQT